eukprot:jgi/Ulvmu1/12121/UM084_0047.1
MEARTMFQRREFQREVGCSIDMDEDAVFCGSDAFLRTGEPCGGMDCCIQTQAVPKQKDEEPRTPSRLSRRRRRRAPRVQPAIHTVMKITQQHLARIYGSALRCGVPPHAAQARINMLIQDARDEDLLPSLDSCRHDSDGNERHSGSERGRGQHGDLDSPTSVEVTSMAACDPSVHAGVAAGHATHATHACTRGGWQLDTQQAQQPRASGDAPMHDTACRVVRLAAGIDALTVAEQDSHMGQAHSSSAASLHKHGSKHDCA